MIEVSNRYPVAPSSDAFVLREDPPRQPEGRRYDLAERTAVFAENVVRFARKLPDDAVTRPLISQVVRSGGSVGANYCEADDAVSKKEFRQKIGTCRKEAKETKYWVRVCRPEYSRRGASSLAGSQGTPSNLLCHSPKTMNPCDLNNFEISWSLVLGPWSL